MLKNLILPLLMVVFLLFPITVEESTLIVEKNALEIVSEQIKDIVELKTEIKCSCVLYVKLFSDIPSGNASDLKPNGTIAVGAVALFSYINSSHVAIVTAIEGNHFHVREANFVRCEITTRKISINDPYLVGFIN